MSTVPRVVLKALTVPLERQDGARHRRELAEALRQLAVTLPVSQQLAPSASSTITSTSYVSVSGSPWSWGVQYLAERLLDVELQLHLQVNGTVLHPLDLQVLLDTNAIATFTIAPQRAFLLTPHPTPLAAAVVSLFCPVQTVGRGNHSLDLRAKTASGGSWTITDDSLVRITHR